MVGSHNMGCLMPSVDLSGQLCEVATGGKGGRVLGAANPFDDWQQCGVLIAGGDRIPASPVQ